MKVATAISGVWVGGKVQRISIGLHCEVRSPPAPLKKGGEEEEEKSALALAGR